MGCYVVVLGAILVLSERAVMLMMLVVNKSNNPHMLNYKVLEDNASLSTQYSTTTSGIDLQDSTELNEEKQSNVSSYKLGDICLDNCYENLTQAFCNKSTNTCQCKSSHPIAIDDTICLQPVLLGGTCEYTQSCLFYDPYSSCVHVTQFHSKCSCRQNYRFAANRIGGQRCVRDVNALTDADIPSVFALGIGLALFTGLTCLVLRLFSRARFGQKRCRYANANLSPPMTMTGMSTPASLTASRRSSMRSGSTPGSRRPSYSMLVTASRPGSRRPSVGSVRSQSSNRSYNRYERNHDRNHDPLRLTMSAPPIRHDLQSPSNNIRILEQKFAQHSGYLPRRETMEKFERELWSRHSSLEIIADVISEAPEKP